LRPGDAPAKLGAWAFCGGCRTSSSTPSESGHPRAPRWRLCVSGGARLSRRREASYVVAMAGNAVLGGMPGTHDAGTAAFEAQWGKRAVYGACRFAAGSWDRNGASSSRAEVVRLEGRRLRQSRFVITNLPDRRGRSMRTSTATGRRREADQGTHTVWRSTGRVARASGRITSRAD